MYLVNFNGKVMQAEECLLPISNRSFRYGDGFFESIRIWKGRSPLFHLHKKRLEESLDILKMRASGLETLHQQLQELAKLNEHENGRARFIFFRNDGGLYKPEDNNASWLIETAAMDEELYPL